MTTGTHSIADTAQSLLQSAGDQTHQPGTQLAVQSHPLTRAAEAAGLVSDVGTIAFAGQYATGSYSVQFNRSDGHGFSSSWPAWAYEIARHALATNKRVWVASNGDPFGQNLVFVMLYAY